MENLSQKLVLNLKSRRYEVMEGSNTPDRVETLQIDRLSPDHFSEHGDRNHNLSNDSNYKKIRDPGSDIEMTAAVSGVVPDDTFTVSQAINALGFGKFQVMLSLFTGLCWMADSMEMMILSILSPALHCTLGIDEYQQAFLTTSVFLGMMISSPFWGNLSDKYGRRLALWVSVGLLYFYGTVSSLSRGYFWLVFLRFFVGFAIGCVPQSVTLYAEFLPTKQRARCVILLDCFWALGACLEVLLALVVMPTLGWRWLLGLSALPILLFCIMCYWLPESVRFLAASGEHEKAMNTLKRIAKDNGRPMLLGRLIVDDMHPMERGRLKDLLMPEMRKTTLLLWIIWMACAFCYYGVVLMSTEKLEKFVTQHPSNCLLNGTNATFLTDFNRTSLPMQFQPLTADGQPADLVFGLDNMNMTSNCSVTTCRTLTTPDYVDLLWTTLAEFPGILVTIFVLDKIGRKKTMAAQFLLFAITIFIFCFPIEDRVTITVILFMARGIVSGVFQAAYVYTPEVYPTSMRAIGIGTCSSLARIGAMVTPYVAQVVFKRSEALAFRRGVNFVMDNRSGSQDRLIFNYDHQGVARPVKKKKPCEQPQYSRDSTSELESTSRRDSPTRPYLNHNHRDNGWGHGESEEPWKNFRNPSREEEISRGQSQSRANVHIGRRPPPPPNISSIRRDDRRDGRRDDRRGDRRDDWRSGRNPSPDPPPNYKRLRTEEYNRPEANNSTRGEIPPKKSEKVTKSIKDFVVPKPTCPLSPTIAIDSPNSSISPEVIQVPSSPDSDPEISIIAEVEAPIFRNSRNFSKIEVVDVEPEDSHMVQAGTLHDFHKESASTLPKKNIAGDSVAPTAMPVEKQRISTDTSVETGTRLMKTDSRLNQLAKAAVKRLAAEKTGLDIQSDNALASASSSSSSSYKEGRNTVKTLRTKSLETKVVDGKEINDPRTSAKIDGKDGSSGSQSRLSKDIPRRDKKLDSFDVQTANNGSQKTAGPACRKQIGTHSTVESEPEDACTQKLSSVSGTSEENCSEAFSTQKIGTEKAAASEQESKSSSERVGADTHFKKPYREDGMRGDDAKQGPISKAAVTSKGYVSVNVSASSGSQPSDIISKYLELKKPQKPHYASGEEVLKVLLADVIDDEVPEPTNGDKEENESTVLPVEKVVDRCVEAPEGDSGTDSIVNKLQSKGSVDLASSLEQNESSEGTASAKSVLEEPVRVVVSPSTQDKQQLTVHLPSERISELNPLLNESNYEPSSKKKKTDDILDKEAKSKEKHRDVSAELESSVPRSTSNGCLNIRDSEIDLHQNEVPNLEEALPDKIDCLVPKQLGMKVNLRFNCIKNIEKIISEKSSSVSNASFSVGEAADESTNSSSAVDNPQTVSNDSVLPVNKYATETQLVSDKRDSEPETRKDSAGASTLTGETDAPLSAEQNPVEVTETNTSTSDVDKTNVELSSDAVAAIESMGNTLREENSPNSNMQCVGSVAELSGKLVKPNYTQDEHHNSSVDSNCSQIMAPPSAIQSESDHSDAAETEIADCETNQISNIGGSPKSSTNDNSPTLVSSPASPTLPTPVIATDSIAHSQQSESLNSGKESEQVIPEGIPMTSEVISGPSVSGDDASTSGTSKTQESKLPDLPEPTSAQGSEKENAKIAETQNAEAHENYPVLQIVETPDVPLQIIETGSDEDSDDRLKIRTDLFQAPSPADLSNEEVNLQDTDGSIASGVKSQLEFLKSEFLNSFSQHLLNVKDIVGIWESNATDSNDNFQEKLNNILHITERQYRIVDKLKSKSFLLNQSLTTSSASREVATPDNLDPVKVLTVDSMAEYFQALLLIEEAPSLQRRSGREEASVINAVDILYKRFYESFPDKSQKWSYDQIVRCWDSVRLFSGELDECAIKLDHEKIGSVGFLKKVKVLVARVNAASSQSSNGNQTPTSGGGVHSVVPSAARISNLTRNQPNSMHSQTAGTTGAITLGHGDVSHRNEVSKTQLSQDPQLQRATFMANQCITQSQRLNPDGILVVSQSQPMEPQQLPSSYVTVGGQAHTTSQTIQANVVHPSYGNIQPLTGPGQRQPVTGQGHVGHSRIHEIQSSREQLQKHALEVQMMRARQQTPGSAGIRIQQNSSRVQGTGSAAPHAPNILSRRTYPGIQRFSTRPLAQSTQIQARQNHQDIHQQNRLWTSSHGVQQEGQMSQQVPQTVFHANQASVSSASLNPALPNWSTNMVSPHMNTQVIRDTSIGNPESSKVTNSVDPKTLLLIPSDPWNSKQSHRRSCGLRLSCWQFKFKKWNKMLMSATRAFVCILLPY
ncbi:unnamed protein product [Allacma fusca]|uniref:Major facilitator superfamily (MFS) profile domain-containing protein n=1 Tax=Allacma fusca TaxID=39272 RepID=A0A8J2PA57_9HEXA|nr:unnamed protein product [Allacma fusca]